MSHGDEQSYFLQNMLEGVFAMQQTLMRNRL